MKSSDSPYKSLRSILIAVFIGVNFWLSGSFASAQDVEVDADLLFSSRLEQMYSKEIKAVRMTSEKDDDLALAAKMMKTQEELKETDPLRLELAAEAFGLSAGNDKGLDTTIAAAKVLYMFMPTGYEDLDETVLGQLRKSYKFARGKSREQVGRVTVDILYRCSLKAEREGDIEETVSLIREMQSIARSVKHEKLYLIDNKLAELRPILLQIEFAKKLKVRLAKNPKDTAAAKKLIDILVFSLNDPEQAKVFLDTVDDKTATLVRAAAEDPDDVSGEESLKLATWYMANRNERNADQGMVLRRSIKYLNKFIDSGKGTSAAMSKAKDDLERMRKELADVGVPANAKTVVIPATTSVTNMSISLGRIRKGQVVGLQYIEGQWTDSPSHPPASPDDDPRAHAHVRSLHVCFVEGNKILLAAKVPGGTRLQPFRVRFGRDAERVFLTTGDEEAGDNKGTVTYRVWVE